MFWLRIITYKHVSCQQEKFVSNHTLMIIVLCYLPMSVSFFDKKCYMIVKSTACYQVLNFVHPRIGLELSMSAREIGLREMYIRARSVLTGNIKIAKRPQRNVSAKLRNGSVADVQIRLLPARRRRSRYLLRHRTGQCPAL